MANNVDTMVDADVEIAQLKSALASEGVAFTPLKATTNNADTYVTLYHAFDGRAVQRIPFYMVDTSEGASRLRQTFTADDVKNANVGPEWIGKRVWYTTPQPTMDVQGKFRCPYSAFNPDEEKEALLERGFRSDCRKQITFATRDEVNRHVEKRHPRRHTAMMRLEEQEYRSRQDMIMQMLLEQRTEPKGK
jgi:hypothetical protein